jgi:hypothetical protein
LYVSSGLTELPPNLSALLGKCSLLIDTPIPAEILHTYCSLKGARQSVGAMEGIHSSTQATTVGGTKTICKFKYGDVSPVKRPDFKTFDMDVNQLEALVRGQFPLLDNFLPDLELKLTQLRSIIYSIKWVEDIAVKAVWNEKSRSMHNATFFELYVREVCPQSTSSCGQ